MRKPATKDADAFLKTKQNKITPRNHEAWVVPAAPRFCRAVETQGTAYQAETLLHAGLVCNANIHSICRKMRSLRMRRKTQRADDFGCHHASQKQQAAYLCGRSLNKFSASRMNSETCGSESKPCMAVEGLVSTFEACHTNSDCFSSGQRRNSSIFVSQCNKPSLNMLHDVLDE